MDFWRRMYEGYHSTHHQRGFRCGADAVDGERYRLMRLATLAIYNGASVKDAVAAMSKEWLFFCDEMQAKIDKAPTLKLGPTSGCSSIHYKHADKRHTEMMEAAIYRLCNDLGIPHS